MSKGNPEKLCDLLDAWLERPPTTFPSNAQPEVIVQILETVGLTQDLDDEKEQCHGEWIYASILQDDSELDSLNQEISGDGGRM